MGEVKVPMASVPVLLTQAKLPFTISHVASQSAAPMLVILMGAIGGMMLAGIVGLFVGSVVLVLGWELLQFSLENEISPAPGDKPQPHPGS